MTDEAPGGGRRILLVEDEALVVDLLTDYLGTKGFHMSSAGTVDEGLEIIQKSERFDILLVDKNLPGRSGIELVREAHKMDPETVILIITGDPSRESVQAALDAGASGYACKPFSNLAEIIELIDTSTERKKRWLKVGSDPGVK